MRRLAISVLALLSTPLAPAQPEQPHPQLFLVHRETVPLARLAEYEASAKALVAALGEAGVGHDQVHFSAISGPELGYAYIVPLGNFAGMDEFIKNWAQVAEKTGPEKWVRLAAESGAAMDHYSDTHFLLRPGSLHFQDGDRVDANRVQGRTQPGRETGGRQQDGHSAQSPSIDRAHLKQLVREQAATR